MTNADIRALFAPAPGTIYLDAATYGLPPRPTVAAMERAVADWQSGRAGWIADWDREGDACRSLFAALIGAAAADVALVPTASVGVGLVAAALRSGDDVLVPEEEFTSVLYPFLVAAQERGVRVREAPFAHLADAITGQTRLVAFSLVQSQSGRTAPLADICRAATARGAQVMVDATHAIPFVPVAAELPAIDYLVCHGYKHLLGPRGSGYLYVAPRRWHELPPILANWRASDHPYGPSFGGPLALAPDAARFDVSLAWFSWVGARPSLELLLDWQRSGALEPVLPLARRMADRLGLEFSGSTLVSVPVRDAEAATAALANSGIRAAARAGFVRFSPHVYNTEEDVDTAAAAIAPLTRTMAMR